MEDLIVKKIDGFSLYKDFPSSKMLQFSQALGSLSCVDQSSI